jgi:hypothetical protein
MCSCHKLIIHTLLKIAQHDISKSRRAERALYIIISRGARQLGQVECEHEMKRRKSIINKEKN